MEEKLPIRDALYKHPDLFDEFVRDNPQYASEAELAYVRDWKKFVSGKFYIERYLKKYAIFIGSDDKVYVVHGLEMPLDIMFDKSYLPLAVEAVLLPFGDKIICDGLLLSYNISFGSGITGNLKEIYLTAKTNGGIIESLTANPKKPVAAKITKNWQAEMGALSNIAQNLRAGQDQPVLHSSVFSLIKASIELGQLATTQPMDTDELWKALSRASKALNKAHKTLQHLG